MNNLGLPIISLGARDRETAQLPVPWMPHIQVSKVATGARHAVVAGLGQRRGEPCPEPEYPPAEGGDTVPRRGSRSAARARLLGARPVIVRNLRLESPFLPEFITRSPARGQRSAAGNEHEREMGRVSVSQIEVLRSTHGRPALEDAGYALADISALDSTTKSRSA